MKFLNAINERQGGDGLIRCEAAVQPIEILLRGSHPGDVRTSALVGGCSGRQIGYSADRRIKTSINGRTSISTLWQCMHVDWVKKRLRSCSFIVRKIPGFSSISGLAKYDRLGRGPVSLRLHSFVAFTALRRQGANLRYE